MLFKADAIGTLINKFLDLEIDLSPRRIDNHSMGTIFEELVRRFNEENNEKARPACLRGARRLFSA
jgi:type I restriction enzyme M protein